MKRRYSNKDLSKAPICMSSNNFASIRKKIKNGFPKNPVLLIEKVCIMMIESFSFDALSFFDDLFDKFAYFRTVETLLKLSL